MTRLYARRQVLAAGIVGVAGCVSRNDEPPPIDVDESALAAIAGSERPEPVTALPVGVTDAYVEAGRDRAESLLAKLPDTIGAEIANEAVATYIAEQRRSAGESLEALADEPTNYARLPTIRRARRRAAEAEGAYAAAVGDRDPADLEPSFADLETGLETTTANLRRVADEPADAIVVYEAVESRIAAAERVIRGDPEPAPGASTVESVGWLAERAEQAAANLADAHHLADLAAETGDRTFDATFETTGTTLIDDLDERLTDVPDDWQAAPETFFDVPIDGTPRELIGQELARI